MTQTSPRDRRGNLENTRSLQVLVVGSCVTRDTFEFLSPEFFKLRGYVARQSLVSAFGPAAEPHFDLSVIPSAFQRRMLEGDARSSLPGVVEEMAPQVDLLLWDLVDERLGFLDHEDGTVSTDSVELRRARQNGQAPVERTGPSFGSSEHLQRFAAVLPRWRALLERTELLSSTMLLAPPWAVSTTTGEMTPSSYGLEADVANEMTERYLAVVAEVLPVPVLGRTLVHPLGQADHQWGPAPFHYDDATYAALANEVAQAARVHCAPRGWEALETRELTRARPRFQTDVRGEESAPTLSVQQTGPLELSVTIHASGVRACSFALHQGTERVDATPYLRTITHRFAVPARGIYRCRVFVMTDDGERVPVTSPAIRVL